MNLLPWAFGEIFKSAFTGRAAFGGFAGATVAQALRFGVARGIFSNEAGLGSASIAHAFTAVLGGLGGPVVAPGSLLFGYSTITTTTWCYYGQQCARYIFGPIMVKPYTWAFVVVAFLGTIIEVPFVWSLTDTLNGAMAIPNLIGLVFLSGGNGKKT